LPNSADQIAALAMSDARPMQIRFASNGARFVNRLARFNESESKQTASVLFCAHKSVYELMRR
jgi:hypothetical protein